MEEVDWVCLDQNIMQKAASTLLWKFRPWWNGVEETGYTLLDSKVPTLGIWSRSRLAFGQHAIYAISSKLLYIEHIRGEGCNLHAVMGNMREAGVVVSTRVAH
ncbi:hypothetical protein Nepgr_018692 [Nepenthes gracilis]|uniref:Uncharacterized protein n=1 Tax=Nepenthes gracilis TaxID=150966 RepID=A0AAD3SVP4_NEPGR|nr:hypothetical protein Nepgr_018692 [Nepenthes gracilis]